VERTSKQLGAASQAKPPPSLVEALDDGRRHAEGQHQNIVGTMSSTRLGTDADPSALGLTQPPSQVANMTRARGPPDQFEVPRLELIDRRCLGRRARLR